MKYKYNGTGKIKVLGRVLEKGDTIEVENDDYIGTLSEFQRINTNKKSKVNNDGTI